MKEAGQRPKTKDEGKLRRKTVEKESPHRDSFSDIPGTCN